MSETDPDTATCEQISQEEKEAIIAWQIAWETQVVMTQYNMSFQS